MKNIFLFVVLFMILSIAKKPEPLQPCPKTLYVHWYKEGKKVATFTRDSVYNFWYVDRPIRDQFTKEKIIADSLAITLNP